MLENVTRGLHERILLVFDFDKTLADSTIDAVLREVGVEDGAAWRAERLQPMLDAGWDQILATAWLVARTGEEQGQPVTRELVQAVGARLTPYDGLEETLAHLAVIGREESGGAEVEFYVLSSGFVDVMNAVPFASCFKEIWGSSLHWDDAGRLAGAKRTVIHSEKARYLRALAKGIGIAGANEPQDVEKPRPPAEWYAPLDQMIYVGDGASDIAAFKLMYDAGGLALAVDHSSGDERWRASEHMFQSARVDNLAAPDYRPDSEMRRSLELAVEITARRVALRRLAQGG